MKRHGKNKKGTPQQCGPGSFPIINTNAAGIDIGSEEHWVAVPEDRDENPVRSFGCFTSDLHAMARWLKACGVTTVAMESTGVYWIPPFQILEEHEAVKKCNQAGFFLLVLQHSSGSQPAHGAAVVMEKAS